MSSFCYSGTYLTTFFQEWILEFPGWDPENSKMGSWNSGMPVIIAWYSAVDHAIREGVKIIKREGPLFCMAIDLSSVPLPELSVNIYNPHFKTNIWCPPPLIRWTSRTPIFPKYCLTLIAVQYLGLSVTDSLQDGTILWGRPMEPHAPHRYLMDTTWIPHGYLIGPHKIFIKPSLRPHEIV